MRVLSLTRQLPNNGMPRAVHGDPSFWDPFRPKFHDLTVRVFERSGHWPHYEEAALFDGELLGWMGEHQ